MKITIKVVIKIVINSLKDQTLKFIKKIPKISVKNYKRKLKN